MSNPTIHPPASNESDPGMITDSDFVQLTALIRERTGIHIPPGKKPLLAARLSERIRSLGLLSYADYHRRVVEQGSELSRMTDLVCTNETRFFRDTEQLAYIERVAIPAWIAAAKGAPRRIRIWSAGCSTGEEAFTIAMVLLAKLPPDAGFSIEVLATDISGAALDRARTARWPAHRVQQEVPEPYRQRFFELDPATGDYEPSRDLRNVVRFQKQNLCDWYYPVTGKFDLLFCRNVLIYFDTAARAGVTRRLVERLAPDGLLFLGMAESLLAVRDGSLGPARQATATGVMPLRVVGPAIYSLRKKRSPHGPPSTKNGL